MRFARSRLLIVLMLAGAMFVAACGGDGDDDPAAGDTGNQEETTEESPTEDAASGEVAVAATEFDFGGVPDTLPAGPTTFTFENVGEEEHEMVLAFIKTDDSIDDLLKMPEKQVEKKIQIMGRTFAKPGKAGKPLEAELEPGRYGMVCFVMSKAEKKPHAFLGMVREITVE